MSDFGPGSELATERANLARALERAEYAEAQLQRQNDILASIYQDLYDIKERLKTTNEQRRKDADNIKWLEAQVQSWKNKSATNWKVRKEWEEVAGNFASHCNGEKVYDEEGAHITLEVIQREFRHLKEETA